ncbi:SHOCT domain-containing protein [Lactobacillus sp. ESL0679]|uniref:SHOCT domain-containing protein n=1 Tax=Lactobacillus sp. ESL0679 TaxID=2983209 RepID=UPI0023F80306|nr:SHOCT domain-containing protein [Lactobacillus sp. ESL0679]MDF7683653.1 SHOCT domain-containing protein [Lactobacillus sp. ESL0679]
MATKKCGICGKELGFWDIQISLKDSVICENCFETGNFSGGANQAHMNKFIGNQTIAEIKELIDDPVKLEAIKRKVAPVSHRFRQSIAQCSFCGKDIYKVDDPLKFKDSTYVCLDCAAKYKATQSHGWASEHTIEDFRKSIKQGVDFHNIYLKQAQKEQAEIDAEKAAKQQHKQEQDSIKAESVCYGGYYFDIEKRKIYDNTLFHGLIFTANADDIVSYHVNEKGHDKTKHHTITRAAVGAIIAGTPGAIIAGTTGGKMNEYIDKLSVVISLTNGRTASVNLLNAKDNKADGFIVRHAYSDLNHVIAILDGWQAQESQSPATPTDIPAEIREYKQLLDDNLITQEEYDAKKKQLLNL